MAKIDEFALENISFPKKYGYVPDFLPIVASCRNAFQEKVLCDIFTRKASLKCIQLNVFFTKMYSSSFSFEEEKDMRALVKKLAQVRELTWKNRLIW